MNTLMNEQFYMMSLRLDASRVAINFARDIPASHSDTGFMVHEVLSSLFGEGVIQPFRIMSESTRWIPVLGYTRSKQEHLQRHAEEFARPDQFIACEWKSLAMKPVPTFWPKDRTVGFEVRVSPIVRIAHDISEKVKGKKIVYRKGTELDAWLHSRVSGQAEKKDYTRDQVYRKWLQDRIGSAALIIDSEIIGFRRMRLVRFNHGNPRKAKILERPDLLMRGVLSIQDSSLFFNTLCKGVGRHRAFGFGMLLLRPVK